MTLQHCAIAFMENSITLLKSIIYLRKENNEYDEEHQDDTKYLYHEPAIGSYAFEVFQKFRVCSLDISECFFNIIINPATHTNTHGGELSDIYIYTQSLYTYYVQSQRDLVLYTSTDTKHHNKTIPTGNPMLEN